jgi:predicted MFS family arabinose efflux permease
MRRGLSPLRQRRFCLLILGQLASSMGDAFYAVALPWYVLAGHGDTLLLGTVLAAYGVPRTVLLAVGGHASDRWHPWNVMMVADSARALAIAALAIVAASGPAHVSLLVPVAAVLGAGEGLFLPGSFSIVPCLLADDELQAGNAISSGGTQLATLIGPAVGGAVVAGFGPAIAFAVDAVTFALSATTLAGIRTRERDAAKATLVTAPDLGVDSYDGQRTAAVPTIRHLLATERVLKVMLIVTVAANLGSGGMSEVALPALARGPFDAGAAGYGGLIAAFAGGAVFGTLGAAQVRRPHRPLMVTSIAFLVEAGAFACVPYLGGVLPAGAALAAFGALNGFGNVVALTAFQRWAAAELRGRLIGLLMLGSFGIFPVSVLLGGLVVRDLGAAAFFPLNASVLAAAILWSLTQPSWRQLGASGGSERRPPEVLAAGQDGARETCSKARDQSPHAPPSAPETTSPSGD